MNNDRDNSNDSFHSALRFSNYIVNSVEFYTNHEFEENPVSIDFNIKRKVVMSEDDNNTMYVTLNISIFENAKDRNYPFSMKVSLTGIFEVDDIATEQAFNLAEINAVAILFPYLRSLISTYTANANVQPLILPPINVVKLIETQARKSE